MPQGNRESYQEKSKGKQKNLAHFIGRTVYGERCNKVRGATGRGRTVGKSAEGEVKKQSAVTERRGSEET